MNLGLKGVGFEEAVSPIDNYYVNKIISVSNVLLQSISINPV